MSLAIFDLDHTLLDGDSDYLWGEYMVEHGIVDADQFRQRNLEFYHQYQDGTLDNDVYLEFALQPLSQHSIEDLHRWRANFIETWIKPIIFKGAPALLEKHRQRGDTLLIISATHLFVTEPVGQMLGVDHLLSTEPEIIDGRYTGKFLGTPTFREGKVTVLQQWIKDSHHDLKGSHFYSDSINDLALLEVVETPITVDPDDRLQAVARERGWPTISLR